MKNTKATYNFTTPWFENTARGVWDSLIPALRPKRILEIGSYEGASTCYLINKLGSNESTEIHCVDTWQGGLEHQADGNAPADMRSVEDRFHSNTKIALSDVRNATKLHVHKGHSDSVLAGMLAEGMQDYFDFIYIDGSHQAPDVLCDAVLSFKLLKTNGVIAFDDYLWQEQLPYGSDPLRSPKLAIDAFTNIYCRKLRVISAPLCQLYVEKVSS
jgi:predicted O-methyltransferase YrrM